MKLFYKYFIFFLLILSVLSTGCDDSEEEDFDYNFKVISSNGSFEGYYIIDGGTQALIQSTPMPGSTIFHSYEAGVSPEKSVLIFATGVDQNATSISIYFYENEVLVKTVTVNQSLNTATTVAATLEYSLTGDTSTTTTTTAK